jgi:hypothetical protein
MRNFLFVGVALLALSAPALAAGQEVSAEAATATLLIRTIDIDSEQWCQAMVKADHTSTSMCANMVHTARNHVWHYIRIASDGLLNHCLHFPLDAATANYGGWIIVEGCFQRHLPDGSLNLR